MSPASASPLELSQGSSGSMQTGFRAALPSPARREKSVSRAGCSATATASCGAVYLDADDEEQEWDQRSTTELYRDQDEATAASIAAAQLRNLPAQSTEGPSEGQSCPVVLEDYKETPSLWIDKVKGCMFVNQYLIVSFLGRGACGKVFLCLNTYDLRLYAMKAVRKVDLDVSQQQHHTPSHASGSAPVKARRNPMDDLKREIMIMKKMAHENVVSLHEVIDDPQGSKLLLVMEFMEGGPVLTREALETQEKLPETMAVQYFRDMVKALDYLHSNKVVHGDLKPENVLLGAHGTVKLSDFGCSKVFATGNEYLERCNGTPAFLAPEMMRPNTRYRGRPTDVYALGACLYTLVYGRIPFSAPNLYKLFQVVQHDPVSYPPDVPISPGLIQILEAMLVKNPRERITIPELIKHPWVTLDGKFPLKSQRELRAEASALEAAAVAAATATAAATANCPNSTSASLSRAATASSTPTVRFSPASASSFTVPTPSGSAPSGGAAAAGVIPTEPYRERRIPRPDYIHALGSLSNREHVFQAGDVIMRQGEVGTHVMYIVQGTVDLLLKYQPPARAASSNTPQQPGAGGASTPPGSRQQQRNGEGGGGGMDEMSVDADAMMPIVDEQSRCRRMKLLKASGKASEFINTLLGASGNGRDLLIAQRGPGELLGEMALFSKTLLRSATVRCASQVVVRIITHEQLVDFLLANLPAKHQIQEGIWKKQSEVMTVEALVKLAMLYNIITLRGHAAPAVRVAAGESDAGAVCDASSSSSSSAAAAPRSSRAGMGCGGGCPVQLSEMGFGGDEARAVLLLQWWRQGGGCSAADPFET
ncbi:MAG: hypothetical protein WDW38_008433 [Sanguina aurantia]